MDEPLSKNLISLSGRPAQQIASFGSGREIVLGIRPEDVVLSPPDDRGALRGEVFVVEDLGNERLVTIDIGGQFVVARTAVEHPGEMGDLAAFTFDAGKAHLFDPGNGLRID